MYIEIDDSNKIIAVMSHADSSNPNIFEVPEDTPDEIIQHAFDYKFIDNEFILDESSLDESLEKVKAMKLEALSMICNKVIESGVDYDGGHYSLTPNDQINLIQLASIAKLTPDVMLPYHADNELCHIYTAQQIVELGEIAISWVTFHTTYFNFLKSQIKEMTSIEEVINAQYGMKPSNEKLQEMSVIIPTLLNTPWSMEIIPDQTDYSTLTNQVDVDEMRRVLIYNPEDDMEELPEEIPQGDIIEDVYVETDTSEPGGVEDADSEM